MLPRPGSKSTFSWLFAVGRDDPHLETVGQGVAARRDDQLRGLEALGYLHAIGLAPWYVRERHSIVSPKRAICLTQPTIIYRIR